MRLCTALDIIIVYENYVNSCRPGGRELWSICGANVMYPRCMLLEIMHRNGLLNYMCINLSFVMASLYRQGV